MNMDANAKKAALRMIPYGLYVLTVKGSDGAISAATVNWVTQTAFAPPLIAIGVKTDSGVYAALKTNKQFALNILGKGQQKAAFAFFKPAKVEGGTLSGEPFTSGANGAPILTNAPSALECRIMQIVEHGDHHTVVAEVTNVHLPKPLEGRPDAAVLEMKDLGDNVFYGG
jgi:flavin reductase (DIM6/NTAB) family NADH-FMN oxidoreductase RutF